MRQDIQIIRAISLLLVLFFHAKISFFDFGYLGVDIFYVISGYLMTKILLQHSVLDSGILFEFYIRRLARLLPAAIVIIFITLTVGFLILNNKDFVDLSRSGFSSLLGFSNIYYHLTGSDYFGVENSVRPLLHFWSLSVEFQFYLTYPLILFAAKKFAIKNLDPISFLLFFSIFLYFYGIYTSNDGLFYLSHFRFFEFMIGAYSYKRFKVINTSQLYIFISLFMFAIMLMNWMNLTIDYTKLVLLSLIGFIIAYGEIRQFQTKNFFSKNIGKVLIFIGNASYSIYLIHLPVFVFYSL